MITLYRNATRPVIISKGWRTQSTSALAATEAEMVGSVGFHRLHLGVLTAADSWPVKFFEASDFHLSIFNMLKKGGIGLMRNTKITSFHSSWLLSPNINSQNIVLFPHQLTFQLSKPGDFEELQQFLSECVKTDMKKDEAIEWIRKNTSLAPRILDDKFSLIVCTHNEVDCRCGQTGSKIFDTLERMRKDRPGFFSTFKSSHIGGHKYAGNIIAFPTGDWYGNMQAAHLPKLLDHLDSGTIFWEHWRGRMGLTKEEQMQMFESKEV